MCLCLRLCVCIYSWVCMRVCILCFPRGCQWIHLSSFLQPEQVINSNLVYFLPFFTRHQQSSKLFGPSFVCLYSVVGLAQPIHSGTSLHHVLPFLFFLYYFTIISRKSGFSNSKSFCVFRAYQLISLPLSVPSSWFYGISSII